MGTSLVGEKEPPPLPWHLLDSHTSSILNISPVIPQKASDLVDMINRVIREGLEGLVLKDAKVSPAALAFARALSLPLSLSSPGQEVAVWSGFGVGAEPASFQGWTALFWIWRTGCCLSPVVPGA